MNNSEAARALARETGLALVEPPASYALTDYGNAERLVAGHGEDLRYCHAWGKWLVWDGTRWQVDATAEVERRAKLTVRMIYNEAAEATDSERRKQIASWAMRSESRQHIDAMIDLAQSEQGIPVQANELDADGWLLDCPNGTIDLRTGELREHRRGDLLTKMAGTSYDPTAHAPVFERFIERILPDADLRRYVQKFAGYSLTGDCREQRMAFWHGLGANGKSTLMTAIMHVLGGYATQMAPDVLTANKYETHSSLIADLFGARFAATVEVGQGKRLAEVIIKQMTGQDRMTARYLYHEPFEWQPTHKIVLVANHKPTIRGSDDAIWRRIDVVPFAVTIPEDERDPDLPNKLSREYSGILRWAVEGCLLWQQERLGRPDAIRIANEQYRSEQDALAGFLDDCCVLGPQQIILKSDLHARYENWCASNGEEPMARRIFTRMLTTRGISEQRGTGGKRQYAGIRLVTLSDTISKNLHARPHHENFLETPSLSVTRYVTNDAEHCVVCGQPVWVYDSDGHAYCEAHGVDGGRSEGG